jgi:hexokinase
MLPAAIKVQALPPLLPATNGVHDAVTAQERNTMEAFMQEVKALFEGSLSHRNRLCMSALLQDQFKQKLQVGSSCMLPSYNTTLPTGEERGKYLAMDLGGSKFRVALVDLSGRENSNDSMTIVKMRTFMIEKDAKALQGHAFFDWMAARIQELLQDSDVQKAHGNETLGMGLAWSFPVE